MVYTASAATMLTNSCVQLLRVPSCQGVNHRVSDAARLTDIKMSVSVAASDAVPSTH